MYFKFYTISENMSALAQYFLLIRPWGVWLQSEISKLQTHYNEKFLKYFLWNFYQIYATTPHWSLVNIDSGNGFVPSGNKPLPEPMLT